MKIRLPNLSSLPSLPSLRRGAPGPSGLGAPSPGGPAPGGPDAVVIGGMGDRMRLVSRRLRGAAGWVFLALFVFVAFVWISLPTRAIAWRIGHEARAAGYLIDIEDLSVWPWGSVTLHNITWTYAPSQPGQVPQKLVLDSADVDISLWRLVLLGDVDVEIDTVLDEGPVHIEYARSDTESTILVDVTEVPLFSVPKLQQALNAPLRGLFALHVDLTLPENEFSKAQGEIRLECSSCYVGDGETPLFVPGATGIMAKGVTLPEIDLGSLSGKLVVADGKATAEKFDTKSGDLELVLTGDMTLKDPFSKSEFGFNLKLLITPALQERSEPLKLMVQTASATTKLEPPDEGWLGFKLRGTGGRPRFMGAKAKTNEERMLERRQKAAEREAKRKAASKSREKPTGEKDSDERNNMPSGGAATGEEKLPELGVQPGTPEGNADVARPEEPATPPTAMPSTMPTQPGADEARPEEQRPEDTRQDERQDAPAQPEPAQPEAPPAEAPPAEGGQDQGQGVGQGGEAQDGQGQAGQEQAGQPPADEAQPNQQ